MNKKRFIITGVLVILTGIIMSASLIQAQTPASTAQRSEPTESSGIDKEVENLKEKIADTVSDLKKDSGTIVAGTISSLGKDSLELTGEANKVFKVTIDDTVTNYFEISGTSKKEIAIDDLEKGDYIFVSGPLLESTIAANGIYRDTPYTVGSGQITALDTQAVTIDMVTTDKEEVTIDLSKKIRPKLMDSKTLEITRTTLAKIKAGDSVHFVVTPTDDAKKVSAVSILIIPQEFFSH